MGEGILGWGLFKGGGLYLLIVMAMGIDNVLPEAVFPVFISSECEKPGRSVIEFLQMEASMLQWGALALYPSPCNILTM